MAHKGICILHLTDLKEPIWYQNRKLFETYQFLFAKHKHSGYTFCHYFVAAHPYSSSRMLADNVILDGSIAQRAIDFQSRVSVDTLGPWQNDPNFTAEEFI